MTCCVMCGWVLDDEHIFNVNCAVAGAANDQLKARIDEERARPLTPTEVAHQEHLIQVGMEIVRDIIALKNFERDLRPRGGRS